MAITYYKRYRMEVDLAVLGRVAPLPKSFRWMAWDDDLLPTHAEVKYACFRGGLDAQVFPCLGSREGCLRLMREIRRKPGFLPGATWMIAGPDGPCATIQGVADRTMVGAIQNVGVVPEYRGLGLGHALVRKALDGFRAAGLPHAYLEVTAENDGAVRLYRDLGFRKAKTLYKAVAD